MKDRKSDGRGDASCRLPAGLVGLIFFGSGFYRLVESLHHMDWGTWFGCGLAMSIGGIALCEAIKGT